MVRRRHEHRDITKLGGALDLLDGVDRDVLPGLLALDSERPRIGYIDSQAIVDLIFKLALGLGENVAQGNRGGPFETVTFCSTKFAHGTEDASVSD